MGNSFGEHWLLHASCLPEQIPSRYKQAGLRIARFPWPLNKLYYVNVFFINWIAPSLLAGMFSGASRLSSVRFKRYTRVIKEHKWSWVRILAMFAFTPLIDVLEQEDVIDARPEHPVRALLEPNNSLPTNYDYIIIGSGAGGAPAALKLSEMGHSVAIIEKGELLELNSAQAMLEKYYVGQGLTLSMTGGTLLVLAGSTVGGTTSINSGTCLRPLEPCLRTWDDISGTDFSGGKLDAYFSEVETQLSACIPPVASQSASARLFKKGLEAIGRNDSYYLPHNALNCVGSGRCCFGCPTGTKQSTDLAYLPQAMRKGARLFMKTEAIGIRETAQGVEIKVNYDAVTDTLSCRNLIISAGAIYTPGLLKRNKIGMRYKLSGRNLKIHPASKVFAYFPEELHGPRGLPQGLGYKPPELPRVTLEGIHTPKSIMGQIFSVGGDRFNWWMEKADYLSSFGLMIRDRGMGSVSEKGSFPVINYVLDDQDAKDIARGLLLIGRTFLAAGAERVLLPLSGDMQKEFGSFEELDEFPIDRIGSRSLITSGFHPQGTAGIGRVVDTNLKVIGSERIYVCDASVLPDSPGVNPQVSIMALSLRLADHLHAILPDNRSQ